MFVAQCKHCKKSFEHEEETKVKGSIRTHTTRMHPGLDPNFVVSHSNDIIDYSPVGGNNENNKGDVGLAEYQRVLRRNALLQDIVDRLLMEIRGE